jgi:hypothetical protein
LGKNSFIVFQDENTIEKPDPFFHYNRYQTGFSDLILVIAKKSPLQYFTRGKNVKNNVFIITGEIGFYSPPYFNGKT